MSSTIKSKGGVQQIENVNQFRQLLQHAISKLSDQSTIKTAQDEIVEIMTEYITNSERLNVFIYHITEFNDSMKTFQKKELIRILGIAADKLGIKLVPFMPKILIFYQKRIKDLDQGQHGTLADITGLIVSKVIAPIADEQEQQEQMSLLMKQLSQSIVSSNKMQQACATQCFTKLIQNAPVPLLVSFLPKLANKLHGFIGNNSIKCKTQLLECLVSLITAVGGEFQLHTSLFIQQLVNNASNSDFNTRKMAVDVIFALAKIVPSSLRTYKQDIADVLNELKFDKMKPVREASTEAMNVLRNVPGVEIENKKQEAKTNEQQTVKSEIAQARLEARKPRVIQNTEKREDKEFSQERSSAQGAFLSDNLAEQEDKKMTLATQKRREARKLFKRNENKVPKGDQLVNRTPLMKGKLNPDFLQQAKQMDGGITILDKDGQVKIQDESQSNASEEQDKVVENPPGGQARNDNNELQIESQFPQLTTIPDFYDDGPLVLTGDQKLHFLQQQQQMEAQRKLEALENDKLFRDDNSPKDSESSRLIEGDEDQNHKRKNNQNTGNKQSNPIQPYNSKQNNGSSQNSFTAGPALSKNQQQSLSYILLEIQKINQQQQRMMESMGTFQNFARTELGGMRQRAHHLAQRLDQAYLMRNNIDSNKWNAATSRPGTTTVGGPSPNVRTGAYTVDHNRIPSQVQRQLQGQVTKFHLESKSASQASLHQNGVPPIPADSHFAPQNDWSKIMNLLQQNQLAQAYSLAISNQDDLVLVKLMGKTGICLGQLIKGRRGKSIVEYLVQRIITILTTKEFVHVLLPWITELSDILVEEQRNQSQQQESNELISQNIVADLIEVLIGLINDVKSGIDAMQKSEIHRIYENLSQAYIQH